MCANMLQLIPVPVTRRCPVSDVDFLFKCLSKTGKQVQQCCVHAYEADSEASRECNYVTADRDHCDEGNHTPPSAMADLAAVYSDRQILIDTVRMLCSASCSLSDRRHHLCSLQTQVYSALWLNGRSLHSWQFRYHAKTPGMSFTNLCQCASVIQLYNYC